MEQESGERELVAAARTGNREAFAALMDRHRPLLLALCRRALGDAHLAEDASQEATLQALLSLRRLRRPDRFGAWLAGIGLNVCRRWLRERAREGWSWEALHGGGLAAEPAVQGPGPEELAEAAELTARVRRAVEALPRAQRSAVLLFYLAGSSQAETAAALGVDVGAVKARLHNARRTLRDRLRSARSEDDVEPIVATPAVRVHVLDVRRTQRPGAAATRYVVILGQERQGGHLSLGLGQADAEALVQHVEGIEVPRPLTYTLAANLLQAVGVRLREVRINRLIENVYYAELVLERANGTAVVDARPSDGLNLAVRVGAPILVAPGLLSSPEGAPSPEGEGSAAIAVDIRAAMSGQPRRSPAGREPDRGET
jgi:RNA polymerase sigma factor (sigma-70 family)